jgi:flagellar hook-associated protein 3 FlgL
MRVTTNSFPNSLLDQLGRLTSRQNALQTQVTTGQRIQLPEDDPAAASRVLDLQVRQAALTQYQSNVATMKEQTTVSYAAMRSLKSISDRAREIATLADGTRAPAELSAYATEVTQLIQQAVQAANGKFHDDYLFAGTKNDQPPFVMTLDANGQVTGVTYQGNGNVAEAEISTGITLSAQTLGANSTGTGPRGLITESRAGADFFNHLISLQNNLAAGNVSAIAATDSPQLARDEDNFLFHVANIGATQARLDTTSTLLSQQTQSLQTSISKEADADLAQTLVQLNATQTAYQAGLQSGALIMSRSLLDYLQ